MSHSERGEEPRSVRSDNVVHIIQIVDNFVTIAFGRNISKEMQLKFLRGKLRRNPARLRPSPSPLRSSFCSYSCLFHINLVCILWPQKWGKQTNNGISTRNTVKEKNTEHQMFCAVLTGEDKCMKCNAMKLNHSSSMSSLPSRLAVDSIIFDSMCVWSGINGRKEPKIPDHFMWLQM